MLSKETHSVLVSILFMINAIIDVAQAADRCAFYSTASLWVQRRVVHLFFFQAEDGIRDLTVTGVQTCALPIFLAEQSEALRDSPPRPGVRGQDAGHAHAARADRVQSEQGAQQFCATRADQAEDRKSVV